MQTDRTSRSIDTWVALIAIVVTIIILYQHVSITVIIEWKN